MKSTFLNMVMVLLAISLVASAAVGGVNLLTRNTIEEAARQTEVASLTAVLPEFDNSPMDEAQNIEQDGMKLSVYTARKSNDIVGYAVKSSANGFAGAIELMVGFSVNGQIINITVLSQSETPGLGAKVKDEVNPVKLSFVGHNVADLKMAVKRDGGDIEAITASTISSRAYTLAVKRAYDALVAIGAFENRAADVSTENVTPTETGFEVVAVGHGFGGDIKIKVLFAANTAITDIQILEHHEDRNQAVFDKLSGQLKGKSIAELVNLTVKKDGGNVDSTSGATVTSRAYLKAVQTAAEELRKYISSVETTNPTVNE